MKKKTTLRTIREQADLSIFELSKLSGVSFEKVRQLDMGYRVEGTRIEIKEKIAHVLKRNVWAVFPDVREAMTKRMEELEEVKKGQALLIALEKFIGDLEIKQEEMSFYGEVLLRMTPDELSDHLYHTGTLADEAKKIMRKFAKKYGVKFP